VFCWIDSGCSHGDPLHGEIQAIKPIFQRMATEKPAIIKAFSCLFGFEIGNFQQIIPKDCHFLCGNGFFLLNNSWGLWILPFGEIPGKWFGLNFHNITPKFSGIKTCR